MKVFLVGSTGYLGAGLLKECSKYWDTTGTSTREGCGLQFSLEKPGEFPYELIGMGDFAIVTAAISSPDVCAREYDRAYNINVTGTMAFIREVIKRGGRVIFFSSDTVYGPTEGVADESGPVHPVGVYGAMKRAVEVEFSGWEAFKAIRLSYVFSFADKFSKYLISCAEKKQIAEVYAPFSRCVVYREDVIDGVVKLVNSWSCVPEGVINFCGPDLVAREDIVQSMEKSVLKGFRYSISEPEASFFDNRPRVIEISADLFAKLLGRRPRNVLEAILIERNLGGFE